MKVFTGEELFNSMVGLSDSLRALDRILALMDIKPGYYKAHRKTWSVTAPNAVVRVARVGTAGPCSVWQCGDERASTIEEWDFLERIEVG